jgi:hypothetical protein
MTTFTSLQERGAQAVQASPLHLPSATENLGVLAVPPLRDLPMSAAAAEAKRKDLEVVLDGVAVLGYN